MLEPVERLGAIARVKSNVRFRAKPNKDAEAIRTLSKGSKVGILLRGEEWTIIEYKNKTGYVMSRYLSFP